jgi:alkylation response protein AidB-like acyl-CoA dehydrogenase
MDFALTDDQRAIQSLAAQILGDGATHERQRALERAGGPRFDADLWRTLAGAGLVGVAVSADHGGTGLGFLELALVVEEIGRRTAPVPLWETAVLGGLAIDRFGSAAQRADWLPALAAGDRIWTAALGAAIGDPAGRPVRAVRDGDGWRLDGAQTCVPAGQIAHQALVAADADAGPLLAAVDLEVAGVTRTALETTSAEPDARLELADVRVDDDAVLGAVGGGEAITRWIVLHANAALAALALGLCEEALRRTAEYTKERKQFGQPIAMFQAVAHRAADAYVDTEAVRLTAWQAASRLAAGEPAEMEVALAKYWAAEGGHRVVHAAQHLHGGVGVDRDYPLHRYFLYARHLLLTLGGPTTQLLRIGRTLAERPAS